jgi:hypothetical protein
MEAQEVIDAVKQAAVNSVCGREVTEHLKRTVSEAVKDGAEDMCKVPFVERQKTVRDAMFHNTESLLYGFRDLEEHLKNEEEYMEMALKSSSKSIIRYQKNNLLRPDDDQLLEDRRKSYERSKNDFNRMKKALDSLSSEKGYRILEMRYLEKTNGARATWEEIAESLAGTDGFSTNVTEKTVRSYKNRLINKLSVLLFGTDAL